MKTVLHVGCGPANPKSLNAAFRSPAWKEVRLDIDPDVKPDIIGTMTDMSAVADASVDAIWSSHNLEHLEAHQVPVALAEFLRVLKPDGFAFIVVPDLQEVCRRVAESGLDAPLYISEAGPISPIDTIYGLRSAIQRGNHFMAHRTGFTRESLGRYLSEAGFQFVSAQSQPKAFNLWALAFKSKVTEAEVRATVQSLQSGG